MKIFSLILAILIFGSTAFAAPAEISHSVNNFSRNYFKTLDKDKNIFYSPYSIAAALSIVANGAKGATQREILAALDAKNIATLNDDFKKFRADSDLLEANLIAIAKNYAADGINRNFQSTAENFYAAEVRTANFARNLDFEKRRIQNFVAENTKNFIADYESSATEETIFDLLNVIYFKGDWAKRFPVEKTWKSNFTNRDGSKSKVQMMAQSFKDEMRYYSDEKFAGIELPYEKNCAMYVILPRQENFLNVAEIWDDADFDYRENFLGNLKTAPFFSGTVEVFIPKFELDVKNNLNENLQQMGIRRAFTDAAEFSNIVKKVQLKISNATHRAKVKVDEKGTTAAAVTEFGMVGATATGAPPRRIYFRADRPFLFVIRDKNSGVDLFTGVVNSL